MLRAGRAPVAERDPGTSADIATPRTPGADERPHRSARAPMHPLTLRFEPRLEREFQTEYFERTLTQVRFALALAAALYVVFGVLDLLIAPELVRELRIIRYAVVSPMILAALALTYHPSFRRYGVAVLSLVVLVATLGIIGMIAIIPAPGMHLYYAGLLLAIAYTFTLVRLSVPVSTALASLAIVAYVVVAVRLNPTRPEIVVNNLFFLLSAAIIGFAANYSMERYARSNFLQRRLIAARTAELEEKNAELLMKNRMLAESRAETLRTARRSELLFSALSDALPGTVLDDKYRIDEKIGAGNFGTVYRGEHLFLHHPVAIKVFRPLIGHAAGDSLDRFRLEGISACRLDHPNAVTVFDFDIGAGSLAYLVMELLQGLPLSEELRRNGRMRPHRAIRVAAAVCDVLAEAHAAGIVHRDIKPSNVFLHQVKGAEQVKVIDFGVARLRGDGVDPLARASTTVTGDVLGTPAYMAPERVTNDAYDGRADVYSVGVMLFEMLTGRLPFQPSAGHWSMAMMHLSSEPPRVAALAPDVPGVLDEVVRRAMAKEPAERPAAAAMAAMLRSAAATIGADEPSDAFSHR
jgi:hypothetical protein